jgi:hypothetical protein
VDSLNVTKLSPWARREIGYWVDERVVAGDVGGLSYGVGRYWEMNLKRAKCWSGVESEYPWLRPRSRSSAARLHEIDPNENCRTMTVPRQEKGNGGVAHLVPYLGHDVFILGDDTYDVRVKWALQFDSTGEIDSFLSLQLVLKKASDEQSEDRGLKQKAPGLFHKLVTRFGPAFAIREMIRLTFGDESS